MSIETINRNRVEIQERIINLEADKKSLNERLNFAQARIDKALFTVCCKQIKLLNKRITLLHVAFKNLENYPFLEV